MSAADRNDAAKVGELSPEDLLAQPGSLRRRGLMAALVVVAALPVIPWPMIALWCLLYAPVSAMEYFVLRRRGYLGGDGVSLFVTFALSTLYALAAAWLVRFGDASARLFAVALVGFSAVNVLLRLYHKPRLFLAAIAPHAVVIGAVGLAIAGKALAAGDYLAALTPVAVVATYLLLLVPTRRRLAEAWGRLVAAKAAAEEASHAKSNFLATMSHEIRTPLNGILGMAQAMQRDELSEVQRERLRVIRRSGEGLLGLLNDALDFAQIEAGKLRIEAAEFDMEHVTRGAVATFAPAASRLGLSFDYSIDDAAKGTFRGDAARLRQVLYNLVSNALKFTDKGGVGVCVSYEDGVLKLEVADSGAGIAPDRIEGLFEQFVQGDASSTRRHGGVGLGLTICRSLVNLMGGEIEVSSAVGRGSVFTVRLPMARVCPPQSADAVLASAQATPDRDRPPIRILAAEDNAVNQLVLKTLLSQAGLEPTVVANGEEAIEAWRAAAWDVILMDVQMPVMDGVAATREIRAAEAVEARPKTPIIAVTANAMTHQIADYRAAGMDLVVSKPIDAAGLFDAIERALDARTGPALGVAAA